MTDGPRLDAVNTNLGLLSDDELYRVYLKALGYPRSPFEGRVKEGYERSRAKRLLTFADAIVYFMIGLGLLNSFSGISAFFAVVVAFLAFMSLLNLSYGVLALGGYLSYRELYGKVDNPPDMASIRLHSPEVLSMVADYLTRPLLDNSRVMAKQLHGEREGVERLIEQASEIAATLRQEKENISDAMLADSYARRIKEADQTIANLQAKRDHLWERLHKIEQETAPIEQQVRELQSLCAASEKLKKIQRVAGTPEGRDIDEEAALDNFAGLSARIEMARQNLAGIGSSVQAYEQALDEVNRLSTNG
jgi:hypothetical protein